MSLYNTGKMKVGEKKQTLDDGTDLLKSAIKTRIKTTMVGAIDSVEKILGFLLYLNEQRELTPEESELKELFFELRKDILDKGNNQIRQIDEDLAKFDITRKIYHITLPVKG